MKIIFFTKGDRMLPSSRTRAHLVADYLRTQGYDAESYHVQTRPWWDLSHARIEEFKRNRRILRSMSKDDILYLHKATEQLDFMFLILLRRWFFGRKYIFDFDDAIFLPTWRRRLKARIMVQNAIAVITGSHYLKDFAKQYNKNAHVISAPIDTVDTYLPREKRVDDPRVRIGWTGTAGHLPNMSLLVQPLTRLVAEGHKIVFVQLGDHGEKIYELMSSIPRLDVEYKHSLPWDQPKEIVTYLQQFDIGVMPLLKNELNRGKDGWKAKEYMGCGVATVLSDWGENPYIVTNEVTGMLVDTEEDWYQALKKLITDVPFREKIAAAGRKRMTAEFSYHAFMPKILHFLESK